MAGYHVNQVHLYPTIEEAINHADTFGGKILEIDPRHLDVKTDSLEFDHPVTGRVPKEAIRPFQETNSATAGIFPTGSRA